MSRRGERLIWCEMCEATLAQVDPNGVVWWANGWHRKNTALEDPERNTIVYTKPRRKSQDGRDIVMDFHRPLRQVCRECGFVDIVDVEEPRLCHLNWAETLSPSLPATPRMGRCWRWLTRLGWGRRRVAKRTGHV